MALHLIIDGYNLMGAAFGGTLDPGEDLELSREALLKRLRRLCGSRPLRLTVVFDGMGSGTAWESRPGVRVAFAGGKGRADAAILRMARDNPQGVVVVTSDRALAENCRRTGAAVLSSAELWARLERAPRSGQPDPWMAEKDSWEDQSQGREPHRKKGPSRRASRKDRREARRLRKL